jgi:PPOX class probable F420-dependent enzyme
MRLTADRCRQQLAGARHAVLATVTPDGSPHAVPITFALDHDVIVTAVDHKPKRTTDLQRLRNIGANPRVAVLADHYDDDWSALWWVRADGTAQVVGGDDRGPVIRVQVQRWSGWTAG